MARKLRPFGGLCKRGHPWTPENLYEHIDRDGGVQRMCRTCERERAERRGAVKRAGRAPQMRVAALVRLLADTRLALEAAERTIARLTTTADAR